jgi:hypothetical protein
LDKEDEMLEELKKIRAAVEKAPPAATPAGLWNEFKDFLSKYKVLGLAVAFVLGLYLGTLVQALVKDFIMPLIGFSYPGHDRLSHLCRNGDESGVRRRRLLGSSNYLHNSGFHSLHCCEGSKKMAHRLNRIFFLFLLVNSSRLGFCKRTDSSK